MKNLLSQKFALFPLGLVIAMALSVSACSQDDRAVSLTEEGRACLRAADAMIEIAQQAVNDPNSRPQRRESRRVLMEGWVARLDAGEDPCLVYADIGQASVSF